MASSSPIISTSAAYTTPSSNTFVLFNISRLVPIKLDNGNFHLWKALFLPILWEHNLLGLIDGSSMCPAQFFTMTKGKAPLPSILNSRSGLLEIKISWPGSIPPYLSQSYHILLDYHLQKLYGTLLNKGMPRCLNLIFWNLRSNFKMLRKGHSPWKTISNKSKSLRIN